MITNDNYFTPKKPLFFCENCEFITNNKKDYCRHTSTRKHLKRVKMVTNGTKNPKKTHDDDFLNTEQFVCICGNKYKFRTGLSRHKNICNFLLIQTKEVEPVNHAITNHNSTIDKELILNVIQQNHDLQKEMFEFMKNNTSISNSNNTNYSYHKTFNLQLFLNETCKNAMNIMDFVDSLQLQISDLEKVGRLGFVEGISDIIIKKLKTLDVSERPVHCSDSKRETVYVKDENKWEKENAENEKMRKAIKRVANKNIQLIPEWKEKYPDCIYSDSKKSDQYNHIIIEAMGGDYNLDRKELENKIIKKITKEVMIEK